MSEISKLVHAERTTPSGGYVLVLNTGALITPEGRAMLQALHSRSVGGIKSHLQALIEKGPDKFIKTYFVGYGHKSIGDMAECVMFIEDVSMLCAKAIQDNRLYRGQEASTRYIDFSKQRLIDPLHSAYTAGVQEWWRDIYLHALGRMVPLLAARHPRSADEKPAVYENAIKARAFDICRSLLPAGAATNIAWTGDFRTASDKLCWLRHHPLQEVREVALALEDALIQMHPSGFSKKRYAASEEYYAKAMQSYYFDPQTHPAWEVTDNTDEDLLQNAQHHRVLSERPPKTDLPKWLEECGNIRFDFLLDFGSFRDLQRHRAVTQRMPLLTTRFGFEPWYLEQFPEDLRDSIRYWIASQETAVAGFKCDPTIAQYYTAMGYRVPNRLVGNIPALVYLAELRGNRFTHPTVRAKALAMAAYLEKEFGRFGLKMHLDPDPDRFDVKRGEQTIIEKE